MTCYNILPVGIICFFVSFFLFFQAMVTVYELLSLLLYMCKGLHGIGSGEDKGVRVRK